MCCVHVWDCYIGPPRAAFPNNCVSQINISGAYLLAAHRIHPSAGKTSSRTNVFISEGYLLALFSLSQPFLIAFVSRRMCSRTRWLAFPEFCSHAMQPTGALTEASFVVTGHLHFNIPRGLLIWCSRWENSNEDISMSRSSRRWIFLVLNFDHCCYRNYYKL
jgi:hypothetical protein